MDQILEDNIKKFQTDNRLNTNYIPYLDNFIKILFGMSLISDLYLH